MKIRERGATTPRFATIRGATRTRTRTGRDASRNASSHDASSSATDALCEGVAAWAIRPARRRDFDAATALCADADVDWSEATVRDDLERSVDAETSKTHRALVAVPAAGEASESDARVVGAIGFCVCVAGETQVTQIATRRSLRRRGLGARVLKAMLGLQPTNVAALEVRATNVAALAMYEKCGFETRGSRRGYYADGVDAVCMTRAPGERPVSTRELTRLLAGLDVDAARRPAPPLPERPERVRRAVVDAPRDVAFERASPDDRAFRMRDRVRRARR
jgi:ribosomal-protein-alanine N-acetyltransferase